MHFVNVSIPKHFNAMGEILKRVGRVVPREVCTSDACEESFSQLRSGGGSHERNPTPDAVLKRLENMRKQVEVKHS